MIEGRDLVIKDQYASDPYCVVYVLGKDGKEKEKLLDKAKTKVKQATLAPKWNEVFTLYESVTSRRLEEKL